jgi:hypothetical protein
VSQHHIRVVGPRESRSSYAGLVTIFTVSRAEDWQRELSPFHLGPVPLYDGTKARCMEGAWQFAKCYAQHLGPDGEVLPTYWSWARRGWNSPAIRYPMGKGAKPEFCLWGGQRLGYVDARKQVYWRLYRDAVRETAAWGRLVELHERGPMALWDFDGFDHDTHGMPLSEVIEQTKRPMGHAFVLKAMLLYGADIDADDVARLESLAEPPAAPLLPQLGLFEPTDAPHPAGPAPRNRRP